MYIMKKIYFCRKLVIMQLESIQFASYKRFANLEELELAPITILVGKNSSGKSSILKLFPLLENSFSAIPKESVLKYENNGVVLGSSFSDIAHNGNSVDLSFGVIFKTGVRIRVVLMSQNQHNDALISKYSVWFREKEWNLTIQKKEEVYCYRCLESGKEYPLDSFSGFVNKELLEDIDCPANLYCGVINVDYIGPIRQVPHRVYTNKGLEPDTRIGIDGSSAYGILYDSKELQQAVSDWYQQNFEGTSLKVKNIEKGLYQLKLQKNNEMATEVNLADEGQGMSQVLPIVVRCLKKDSVPTIIVVEQPELHLHPAAHENLAKLFANTSKELNHSYIIETHSENILLGIRDAIVDEDNPLDAKDVLIYFVDEDDNKDAYLQKITIDNQGNMSDWPLGVFNESYEILKSIKEKASKKEEL